MWLAARKWPANGNSWLHGWRRDRPEPFREIHAGYVPALGFQTAHTARKFAELEENGHCSGKKLEDGTTFLKSGPAAIPGVVPPKPTACVRGFPESPPGFSVTVWGKSSEYCLQVGYKCLLPISKAIWTSTTPQDTYYCLVTRQKNYNEFQRWSVGTGNLLFIPLSNSLLTHIWVSIKRKNNRWSPSLAVIMANETF